MLLNSYPTSRWTPSVLTGPNGREALHPNRSKVQDKTTAIHHILNKNESLSFSASRTLHTDSIMMRYIGIDCLKEYKSKDFSLIF